MWPRDRPEAGARDVHGRGERRPAGIDCNSPLLARLTRGLRDPRRRAQVDPTRQDVVEELADVIALQALPQHVDRFVKPVEAGTQE